MFRATIVGVGSYLPSDVLANEDLEGMVETTDEWIFSRTGIRERRRVAEGEATSDMAAAAGAAALGDAGVAPDDVDLLIVATSTPDMLFPSAACLAQAKLGLTCPAYDVNAACTGFVYALQAATAMIESGRARTILVVGADTLTRFVDFTDRTTCVLFGDGAGAVVLEASDEPGVLAIELGADGTVADMLSIPAGGSAAPCTAANVGDRRNTITMNGPEVFKFAVRATPDIIVSAAAAAGIEPADIDWIVPHQANQRIIDAVSERLSIPAERVFSHVVRVGNTSAASIPLALDELYTSGRLSPGDALALVGFGAGMTWGAAIVRWTATRRQQGG